MSPGIPLHFADEKQHLGVIRILLEHGPIPRTRLRTAIHTASHLAPPLVTAWSGNPAADALLRAYGEPGGARRT